MAREEINFIRPQEIYDVGNKTSKVAYTGYDGKPHELEVVENLEGDVEGVINDTFKENDNNNVAFTDNEGNEHELITSEGFGDALNEALPSALANAQVITTTWAELKNLRDNKQLIAGSLCRITDYNCTTTQENTQSAGHQFDIVLLALSENKLAEEGWAMEHPTDVYDVTFSDGITKKCYMIDQMGDYSSCILVDVTTLLGEYDIDCSDRVDETNKTIIFEAEAEVYSDILINEGITYNYFQNSNLSAWKVWYCLDNDKDRFAWADDSVDEGSPESITLNDTKTYARDTTKDTIVSNNNYYGWTNDATTYYTKKVNNIDESTSLYVKDGAIMDNASFELIISSYNPPTQGTGLPNGRGVIYRLIDEWMNDVGYDFKNIQFIRPMTDGEYDDSTGTDTWVYTFSWNDNGTIADGSMRTINDDLFSVKNTIEAVTSLNNNVFLVSAYDCKLDIASESNTLIMCNGVSLHNTFELVIEDDGAGESAIYLNNKKVLTET